MSENARMEGKSREQLVEEVGRLRSEMEALGRVEAERRRMEERTKHLNLVLRTIREVNQLITREKGRDRLLQGICSTLTETRGYFNAWIALLDENGGLLDWADSGLGRDFLPLVELLKKGELPRCVQTTLGRPGVVAIQDPVSACGDCPLSQKYGGRGAMTARLEHAGKVYGVTVVSTPVEFARDPEEQALLGEVAADIASALPNIELEKARAKAEEVAKESEEFSSSLISNSPNAILVIDPDSSVRYVSPAFEALTGFSAAEVIGARAPYPWWTEETPHKTAEDIREIIRQGGRRLEEPFQKKNGERLWAEVNGTPVLRDGELRYYLANWVDVTDRKRAEEELETSRQELRELAAHIESVREEERTGIARELHDEIGQALTAIKIDLSWLRRELPEDQAPLLERTRAVLRVADSAIKSVRRISSDLRPGILDDLGLTAAIQWYAGEFEQRTGVKCEVSVEREVIVLEQDRSTAVFRILQEALTNVARHAGATRVEVSLSERNGRLVLEIADDGKGISARQFSNRKAFGLMGMRERAAFLGGELQISGEPGQGTRVTLSIPLRREGDSAST